MILAVAGAGKTSYLLDKINTSDRFLIVTYTIENQESIRTAILSKFGFIPQKVHLYTYFQFLFQFCYKPVYSDEYNATGICFEQPHQNTLKFKRDNPAFVLDCHRRLYHNRIYIGLICCILFYIPADLNRMVCGWDTESVLSFESFPNYLYVHFASS